MRSIDNIIKSSENKLILLSFFQTTCAPCISEIRELLKVQNEFKVENKHNFDLVLISSKEAEKQLVHSFLRRYEFTAKEVLLDPGGRLDPDYKFTSMPVLVIVNKERKVIEDLRGQVLSRIRDKLGFKELIEKHLTTEECK